MNKEPTLRLRAGPEALRKIRQDGLHPGLISHIAGAAGGPKWLMLGRLDRVLISEWLSQSHQPVKLIGSSAGAWRMCCLSQADPLGALDRFEAAYLSQRYSLKPNAAEVTAEVNRMLDWILGEHGIEEILANPRFQLNVITMHCRGALGSAIPHTQLRGILLQVLANGLSRRLLSLNGRRVLFHLADAAVQYRDDGIPTDYIPTTSDNLRAALLATASIPYIIDGVQNIPDGPPGMYRDGGVIDYHMDLPLAPNNEGIVLLPHFTPTVTTGWFDKFLPWRKPINLQNTLLITPTPDLLARLSDGRIPSRKDFKRYNGQDDLRLKHWQQALGEAQRMADEWHDWAQKEQLTARVEPL